MSVNKSVALLLVLVFLTASSIVVAKPALSTNEIRENSWVSKAPMHVARSGLGVAVVNGKIYAIGGSTQRGDVTSTRTATTILGTNEEYDPATDTWTLKAPMPTPRAGFAIAVYQNKIYCIGQGVNEVYDPATDTWTSKTPMPTTRDGAQASVVNGKIYVIGGIVSDSSSPSGAASSTLNEVYDPATDSWTKKESIPNGIWGSSCASAVVDNKIYVIGGLKNNHNLNQIYDVETNKWSYGASPPSLFYGWTGGAAAAATTGEMASKLIYVLSSISPSNQVYDPKTDSWTVGANVPTNREDLGVAVINDTLYAIGGRSYHFAYPDDTIGVSVTEYAVNEQYTPVGYGTPDPSYVPPGPPEIAVLSPENKTYASSNVSLAFTVNKPVSWTGYGLDGHENVTVTGNTTLSGLTSGLHNITVYAKDELENIGASETITFSVEEPFPTTLVTTASAASAAVIGIGLLIYFRKRNH